MQILPIIIFLFVTTSTLLAQTAHKRLRNGDKAYEMQDYQKAEEEYKKAQQIKEGVKSNFNLGNSVYNLQRFEEASQHFEAASKQANNDNERSLAYYNLGNSLYNTQQFDKSIEAYKESIRLNPKDLDARKNLFLSKLMLQQQQQQQQQQNEQEQQEEDKNDENQENQNKEGNEENQEANTDESQIDNENPNRTEEEETEQQLSLEDAIKLLQVIENEEKKVQEKLRKVSGNKKKPEKDW